MKKSKNFLVYFFAIFIVLGYVAYMAYRYYSPSYVTEPAILYSFSDTVKVKSICIKNEKLVKKDANKSYFYECDDSDVVNIKTSLALEFDNASDLNYYYIAKNCRSEIEALKQASSSNKDASDNDYNLILEDSIILNQYLYSGNYNKALDYKYKMLEDTAKLNIFSGLDKDYSQRIIKLEEQYNNAINNIDIEPRSITSDVSGYFCKDIDGFEKLLTSDFNNVDLNLIDEVIKKDNSLDYIKNDYLGKILYNHKWYIVSVFDDKYENKLVEGQTIRADLGIESGNNVPLKVDKIIKEDDKIIVFFYCERLNEKLINIRTVDLLYTFGNYSGVKINKKALRFVSGVEGVFIKSGNLIKFKPVEVLYYGDDFIVCKVNNQDPNSIDQFDDIVLEGKDLYDGKIL